MTFTEMVKLIHPDVNPHIKDAGEKMELIKRYRNNSVALHRFAIKWGLVKSSYKLGNIMRYVDGKKVYFGIIVDINKDKNEIMLYNIEENGIFTVTLRDMIQSYPHFFSIGEATEDEYNTAKAFYDFYNELKNSFQGVFDDFEIDIKSNTRYNEKVEVFARNDWRKVIRTTAKRVYFYDYEKGKESWTNLNNIEGARRAR